VSRSFNFPPSQIPLMHVLSTDGDTATKMAFPLGQKLGLLMWQKADLKRRYGGIDRTISEHDLDTTTIGNLTAFRTGPPGASDRGVTRLENQPVRRQRLRINSC